MATGTTINLSTRETLCIALFGVWFESGTDKRAT